MDDVVAEPSYLRLGVNIDHVATLRNARGGVHPDPVDAAAIAIAAGADGITAHLREDRRHIRDEDVARLMRSITVPLNLEIAATAEMVAIARATRPHACCVVPERRQERTTEGGLDVIANRAVVTAAVRDLTQAGIRVSLFVAAAPAQIEAAAESGAAVVELHTGAWCDALAGGQRERAAAEWSLIVAGAALARQRGLEVHAGHGLDYRTAGAIAALAEIVELNIGHFLVGEALAEGLGGSVRKMRAAMAAGRGEVR